MNKIVAILSLLACFIFFEGFALPAGPAPDNNSYTCSESGSVTAADFTGNDVGNTPFVLYNHHQKAGKSTGWKWLPDHKSSFRIIADHLNLTPVSVSHCHSAFLCSNRLYILHARILI